MADTEEVKKEEPIDLEQRIIKLECQMAVMSSLLMNLREIVSAVIEDVQILLAQ